ncbi:MAG: SDR family NAD(P)-dependent oxidoreductase [Clostridia bacterium]|nr:SDR family NAD(P)-dependent oxidoreductase [Clostridia bacterium]
MKKAIIVGASSGIGRELAKILSANGYILGLAARRTALLQTLQKELPNPSHIKCLDLSAPEEASRKISELIDETGGMDLIIISSGVGYINEDLEWDKEKETIAVNVSGFSAAANAAAQYFMKQGLGHIAGISSVAAIRGGAEGPAYNASKAFQSNYMEGLRIKFKKKKLKIMVTDIKPGFVDTEMAKGEGLFWVAPPKKAAKQIYRAIIKKKNHVYVTKRWLIFAWLLKLLPYSIYSKL